MTHAVYYIVPTTWFGWSIGKYWTGLRVVDRRTLRAPSPMHAGVRWLVAALPMLAALFAGLNGNAMTVAVFAVYTPIVVDLRGAHDYAARTVVVERTPSGPGIWVRTRAARKND